MKCPRDQSILNLHDHFHLNCTKCKGDFLLFPDQFQKFLEHFHEVYRPKKLRCPSCESKMKNLKHNHGSFYIESCGSCKGFWLDDTELKRLKNLVKRMHRQSKWLKGPGSDDLKSKEKLIYENYQQHSSYEKKMTLDKAIFQIIMNMPIEHNIPPFRLPVVTWTFIIINVVMMIKSFQLENYFFMEDMAFYADKPSLKSAVTSMFSHASLGHLFGNMYFIKILGDNVEDLMGHFKFAIFYLTAGILSLTPFLLFRDVSVPLVGASGAGAAIIGSYLVLFPNIKFNLRFLFVLHFNFSCWALVVLWILIQLLLALKGSTGPKIIAWDVHLAGFFIGLIVTHFFKKSHLT